jgi:hypothetical protein
MSFKLFIYYCALLGGWAALVGWGVGQALASPLPDSLGEETRPFLRTLILGLTLGASVACALGFLDVLWGLGGRHMGQALMKGMVVAVIGCISGLLGSAVGQVVYRVTNWEASTVFGWTLTGLLIGASIGLYDLLAGGARRGSAGASIRKIVNGCIGGFLGGLIGGVLHLLLGHALQGFLGTLSGLLHRSSTGDEFKSTSAWGFVILGICIGLFIGLAQVILKEAWVKVEAGFRAGREMLLSKDEITIGRAEGCDIGLFGDNGVERTHCRIQLKNHRYLLFDADTPGGTYVNDQRINQPTPLRDGDLIRVGKSLLRFGERQKRK